MPETFAFGTGALIRWSRWSFILALALFPLLIVPLSWFPFQLAKLGFFAALLLVSTATYALASWRAGTFFVPRHPLLFAVGGYLAAVLISTALSQNPAASFIGEAVETDTLLFSGLLVLVFSMAAAHFREPISLRSLWSALLISGLLAALFQALQLAFGPNLFGPSILSTVSSSVVGRWNDLGVLMAFTAIAGMLAIDIGRVRGAMLAISGAALAASLALLSIINLDVAWWVVLGASALTACAAYFNMPGGFRGGLRRLPSASMVAAAIAVALIVWGGALSPKLNDALGVEELEIRPSAQATVEIMRATYAQSTFTTLVGSGPATFNEQWLLHKPAEINLSQFWNIDFFSGFGAIPTMFITLGVVGGLALLLLPLLALITLVRLLRSVAADPAVRGTASIAAIGAVSLFALAFVYATGQLVFILAFALLGVYTGLVSRSRPVMALAQGGAVVPAVLAVIVIAALGILCLTGQRFLATAYLGKAVNAANAGTLDVAEKQVARSIAVYRGDDALRFFASVKVARAQAALANTAQTEAQRAEAFQTAVSDAVASAREAVAASPRSYTNWLALARIYEALIPLEIAGAYQSAQQSYVETIRRNPRNPGLYLAAARMEGAAGQEQPLRDAVNQALQLKPNYTDAVLLILQVEIAKKNLEGAIQASMAAIQTAPDNAGLWLQLGLLALNAQALPDAQAAFEQALTLLPDYANAKYFLGLTYYAQGKSAEAVRLFEDLASSNPDNAEVALVLSNMRAGKPAFDGATPPVTNPTSPTNPPIKEE